MGEKRNRGKKKKEGRKTFSSSCYTRKIIIVFLALILSSCTSNKLTVYSDYLSLQNLASYYVHTPDPCLSNPPIGQRLLVFWSFSSSYMRCDDLHLLITIRFRNREQIEKKVCLTRSYGSYIYQLLNEDFFEKGGFLTYKVDLVENDTVIEEWRHQLWTELITIDKP